MATKPADLLKHLPSVNELLDKPPVRVLADRWNRSQVAAGVKVFLEDLRNDLQRRAAEAGLPSPRELAERAARHVIELHQPGERPAINATGRLYGWPWVARPLAEPVLERVFRVGREFVAAPAGDGGDATAASAKTISQALSRIVGSRDALVVHSYAGGIWLALAALAAGRQVLVARGELGAIDADCTLLALAESTGATIREVGATNQALAADYESAVTPAAAAILSHVSDGYAIVGESASADLESLVNSSRRSEVPLIRAIGSAPLVDLPQEWSGLKQSVAANLASGADLVIARGDGLAGGPMCGLIFGRRDLVQRIESHAAYHAWRLDPLRTAALMSVLEIFEGKSGDEASVSLQLLTTPLDNLRNRAERIASQLIGSAGIASAEALSTQSELVPGAMRDSGLTSYGVAVTPTDGDAEAMCRRLAALPLPLWGRVAAGRMVFDLRFVLPRQDQSLVESLGRGEQGEHEEHKEGAVLAGE